MAFDGGRGGANSNAAVCLTSALWAHGLLERAPDRPVVAVHPNNGPPHGIDVVEGSQAQEHHVDEVLDPRILAPAQSRERERVQLPGDVDRNGNASTSRRARPAKLKPIPPRSMSGAPVSASPRLTSRGKGMKRCPPSSGTTVSRSPPYGTPSGAPRLVASIRYVRWSPRLLQERRHDSGKETLHGDPLLQAANVQIRMLAPEAIAQRLAEGRSVDATHVTLPREAAEGDRGR